MQLPQPSSCSYLHGQANVIIIDITVNVPLQSLHIKHYWLPFFSCSLSTVRVGN